MKYVCTCALLLMSMSTVASAQSEIGEDHRQVTVSFEALHLFVPVFQLRTELALSDRIGVSVLGGYGKSTRIEDITVWGAGAQGAYYFSGRFDRGFLLGVDAHFQRVSDVEAGEAQFFSLGDGGVAVGPFAGYKRAFESGLTLEAQVGAQGTIGEAADPVILHVALSAGWSFWRAGSASTSSQVQVADADREPLDPLDTHDGLLLSWFLGGGVASPDSCDDCGTGPGMAAGGSIGWFLHRRVAILYDAAAALGIVDSSFASVGFGLQSLAVQYWPRGNVWVKGGVGVATLLVATPIAGGETTGGGGTLAAGYEFHHNHNFAMDVHLRAIHGSFDTADGDEVGIDAFCGGLGIAWY